MSTWDEELLATQEWGGGGCYSAPIMRGGVRPFPPLPSGGCGASLQSIQSGRSVFSSLREAYADRPTGAAPGGGRTAGENDAGRYPRLWTV